LLPATELHSPDRSVILQEIREDTSKKKAFWYIWLTFTIFIILFFYAIGELDYMDVGKSILLTIIPLSVAYPIPRWLKHNDFFSHE
jgi:hypothetical protein